MNGRIMLAKIIGLLGALGLVAGLGIVQAPSSAQAATAYTALPVVEKRVSCAGWLGYAQAWFLADSAGRRKPYRGGWRMDSTYNIKVVNVTGVVGGNAYRDPAITFGSGQKSASQYVPSSAPYGARSAVSVSPAITLTDGTKCIVSIPSN